MLNWNRSVKARNAVMPWNRSELMRRVLRSRSSASARWYALPASMRRATTDRERATRYGSPALSLDPAVAPPVGVRHEDRRRSHDDRPARRGPARRARRAARLRWSVDGGGGA